MLDFKHLVEVFEAYILSSASDIYKPTYASNLFSFVVVSPIFYVVSGSSLSRSESSFYSLHDFPSPNMFRIYALTSKRT